MCRLRAWSTGASFAILVAGCGSGSSNQPGSTTPVYASGGATSASNGGASATPRGGTTSVASGGLTSNSTTSNSSGTSSDIGGTSSIASTGGTTASYAGGSPSDNARGGAVESASGGRSGNTGGQSVNIGGTTSGRSTTATGGKATGGVATGGVATGGVAMAGGPAAPELVTSGPTAYWKTGGQVTAVTSGSADLTVDVNTKYQVWDGFGGTFNEMGWDAISVVSSETTNALRLLFDAHDGANFVFGRIPLGASDYSMSWYTLDDTAGDYSMDKFSIARDRDKLIPYIKAALQIKPDLHLWASPWVIPDWMMDSSKNMKSDAQTLGAHALYMARFVEEYAKEGLKVEAIHPQNEPGYARVHWTSALFINFIKSYLGPTFAQRNLTAEIWCGTMSKDPDDTNIAKALANDADAMKYTKGFGVQWNLQAVVGTLATKGPVMQTEHRCGNYNFDAPYWDKSRYSSSKPQNDHLYGEESWQLIRDWIVSGVNSYSAWNMVLDTNGKSLDGWPQNALLVVDRTAKKLTITAAYYAFRHFSQYIAPGATRIGTSGSSDAVAFKNPDGSIITEIYNKGDSSKKMTVKVDSASYQFDLPAHGWATLRVTS